MSSSTWLILDLETTGLNPQKGDVIIDIAAIKGNETGITETFQSYVHPGDKEVSSFVQTLTGISLDTLRNAPSDNEVLSRFKEFLGDTDYIIIGHNIGFDVDFLRYYGIHLKQERLLDTNDFATLFFPEVPSHSLEVLANLLEVEHTAKHTALGDVHATYELLQAMLAKYEADYKASYVPWLPSVLERITSWGGKAFFELTLPPRGYTITEKTVQKKRPLHLPTAFRNDTLYIIPEYTERESTLLHLAKESQSTLILSNGAMDNFKRIRVEEVLFFDSPFSFLSESKVKEFLTRDSYTPEEALWAIRAHTLSLEKSIHSSTLPLTYKERTFIQSFCIDSTDQSAAEMTSYLENASSITTSYYQYFFGEYSSILQKNNNIVIGSTAEAIPDIARAGRSLLDEDSYLWKIQKLKNLFATSEQFSAITSSRDLEALEHVVHYFFQNLEKERTNGATRLSKESVYKYAPLFLSSVQKAVELLLQSTDILHDSNKDIANTLLHRIQEETVLFLSGETEDYVLYGEYYNNAVHLIREFVDVDRLAALLRNKNCIYTDSRILPKFPYIQEFTEHQLLVEDENMRKPQAQLHISPTLRAEDTEYLAQHLKKDTKTLLLLNSATKCERIFDHLYEHVSSPEYVVLSHGKSGGSGKISYLFEKTASGVLIQRPSDTRVDRLPSGLQEVIFTSLPFYIVQGSYFETKYERQVFGLLTLPLTYKGIADFIDKMQRLSHTININILDDRMQSKSYGLELTSTLEKEFGISQI